VWQVPNKGAWVLLALCMLQTKNWKAFIPEKLGELVHEWEA